jgi:hypothetical protein
MSFRAPFMLPELDHAQPAGDYLLDTDEELIEGISRLAWRRVATFLHLPAVARARHSIELVAVDSVGLDAAQLRDRGLTM